MHLKNLKFFSLSIIHAFVNQLESTHKNSMEMKISQQFLENLDYLEYLLKECLNNDYLMNTMKVKIAVEVAFTN